MQGASASSLDDFRWVFKRAWLQVNQITSRHPVDLQLYLMYNCSLVRIGSATNLFGGASYHLELKEL